MLSVVCACVCWGGQSVAGEERRGKSGKSTQKQKKTEQTMNKRGGNMVLNSVGKYKTQETLGKVSKKRTPFL